MKGPVIEDSAKDEILHEENNWGISLIEETIIEPATTAMTSTSQLPEGLQVHKFVFPYRYLALDSS